MQIDKLLSRLDYCKSTGNHQWHSRCPAHDDHSPSLSIKSETDGRILIHCHAGCSPLDVISSLGLEWDDLFPQENNYPARRHKSASTCASIDELVLAIGKAAIREGKSLSSSEKQKMRDAFLRKNARNK